MDRWAGPLLFVGEGTTGLVRVETDTIPTRNGRELGERWAGKLMTNF